MKKVKGRSRSVIQSCGCDQEGRKLSWKTRIKEVGFEVFPERCDRGAISFFEGEGVPENWRIVTERIGEMFYCFMNLTVESGSVKEFEFGDTSPCVPGRSVGMN